MKSGENERSCAHAGAGIVLRENGERKIMTRVLYKGLQGYEMQTFLNTTFTHIYVDGHARAVSLKPQHYMMRYDKNKCLLIWPLYCIDCFSFYLQRL